MAAEVFTGKKGAVKNVNSTPLEDTIRSFEEIADGKWDHLSEQAFMTVFVSWGGSIEQAAAQEEKLQEAAKKK